MNYHSTNMSKNLFLTNEKLHGEGHVEEIGDTTEEENVEEIFDKDAIDEESSDENLVVKKKRTPNQR